MSEVVSRCAIVGLSGKIGSGKTTLADALIAKSEGAVCCNFGDALKREVAAQFDIPVERCYSQEEKNRAISETNTLTIGEALQQVGAARRAEQPEYWLERLDEYIAALPSTCKLVVVGDVRHVNEARWVSNRGGLLVRLNGDPAGVRAASKRDLMHKSETDLDDYAEFDVVCDTDSMDADAVVEAVDKALSQWYLNYTLGRIERKR